MDKAFEAFCNDGSDMSVGDLLTWYSNRFHEAFFNEESSETQVSDEELTRWLNWCLYYGKPREEYPLANQD